MWQSNQAISHWKITTQPCVDLDMHPRTVRRCAMFVRLSHWAPLSPFSMIWCRGPSSKQHSLGYLYHNALSYRWMTCWTSPWHQKTVEIWRQFTDILSRYYPLRLIFASKARLYPRLWFAHRSPSASSSVKVQRLFWLFPPTFRAPRPFQTQWVLWERERRGPEKSVADNIKKYPRARGTACSIRSSAPLEAQDKPRMFISCCDELTEFRIFLSGRVRLPPAACPLEPARIGASTYSASADQRQGQEDPWCGLTRVAPCQLGV